MRDSTDTTRQRLVLCHRSHVRERAEGSRSLARRDDEVVSVDTSRRGNAAGGRENPSGVHMTSVTEH